MNQRLDNFVGANQIGRLNHLEVVCKEQNRIIKEIATQFAWYWYDEKIRTFAVISKLEKDEAELIAFSGVWSGGNYVIDRSKLLIRDPDKPEDELKKTGKWEPMLNLSELIRNFGKEEAAPAEAK